MDFDEWPSMVPLVQIALNNFPSPHRAHIAPLTAFTGMIAYPPISTFFRLETASPVTLSDVQRERALILVVLQERVSELHPHVQGTLQSNR